MKFLSVDCLIISKSVRRKISYSKSNLLQRVRLSSVDCTPRKQKLRSNNKILKAKYRNLKLRYQHLKSKSVLNCPKTLQFIKKFKSLSSFGKLLVDSQLSLTDVKTKGRRYTDEEKIFALSLFKLSPKCYAYLRKYLICPASLL